MKREMELVRAILLELEQHARGLAPESLTIRGYTDEQVGFHCYLMKQAGLITGRSETFSSIDGSPRVTPFALTWDGYEFLENTKNPTIWQQTRELIGGVGGASFSVWSTVAAQVVMKNLGL